MEADFVTLEEADVGMAAEQGAAGTDRAVQIAGERLGGESEVDGIARGKVLGMLADQFLEILALVDLEGRDFGKQAVSERIHAEAAFACLGFGAAGEEAVGAGRSLSS
ncbi:MAG: hypothetical protein Q8N47_04610 [Bryobacterales bacterium]|nr:hypothetical protein [Bryobacterales bacterium]